MWWAIHWLRGVITRKSLILPALGEFGVTYWGATIGLRRTKIGLAHTKMLRILAAGLFGKLCEHARARPTNAGLAIAMIPRIYPARWKTMTS